MAIWMELQCEARTQDFACESVPPDYRARCLSNENAGPMEMALDTQESVIATYRSLVEGAKRGGWKKTKSGLVCPDCAKHMKEHGISFQALDT